MIRDRGRIKWTSMMLPEHVKMLRDWAQEDQYEKEKQLDEQQLEQLNETILEAMEYNRLVSISYFRHSKYELVIGKVHYWDELGEKLHIIDRFEEIHLIEISAIADVRLAVEW